MPSFTPAPGVALHWEEAGEGPPLVLVHGWSLSGRAFGPQLRELAAGRRVIAPDLRGHGRSRVAAGAPQRIEDHARDLAALLEHLDLRRVVLAGWSLGGQVALEALPHLQPRLAALALLSATPRFTATAGWEHGLPEASVHALAARLARRPGPTLARFFDGMFAPGELDPAALAALRAEALEAAPPMDPAAARAGLDALLAGDQRRRLAEVRVPLLVVHGDRDPIALPGAAQAVAAAVPGARLRLLPGAGHAPQLARAGEVSGLLAAFAEEARR